MSIHVRKVSLLAFLISRLHPSSAFINGEIRRCNQQRCFVPFVHVPTQVSGNEFNIASFDSTDRFNDDLRILCDNGNVEDAVNLLKRCEEKDPDLPSEASYTTIIRSLAELQHPKVTIWAEELLQRMKLRSKEHPNCLPTADAYNAVILAWSKSLTQQRRAAVRCNECLEELWSLHRESGDSRYVPFKSSYVSAITAISRSAEGRKAAEQAEKWLEDMERARKEHPHLAPTTLCCNVVLNAWSKSGSRDAANRCVTILERMEDLYLQGRRELQPDSTSFNTAIDALAHSRERGSERRAEDLLHQMEELANTHEELAETCRPDAVSFNAVLNAWARSRDFEAARRATDILQHMEQRYASNSTTLHPDETSYATVINAWAFSKEKNVVENAEKVLSWLEEAYDRDLNLVKPGAVAYNSIINCYAKSNHPDASNRALAVLERMKSLSREQGRDECTPDVISYTSVIDTLAKQGSRNSSEVAESLLEELETDYRTTGNRRLKPNIKTYTSVINAIGRSGENPERAEAIVNRLEASFKDGDGDVQPDVVAYNSLLNAYGWSNITNKSLKCFEIYKHMVDLYETGNNVDAKPDIITCNSILNACAFEKVETDSERAAVMQIVIQTVEAFQSARPSFGIPNYLTYANVLSSIVRHMPMGERRLELAEATFWQCCRSGQVSTLVVVSLHKALPWAEFSTVMGPALKSGPEDKLRFDLSRLPPEWTRYAPAPGKRTRSRPSKKRANFEINRNKMTRRANSRRKASPGR